jgi:prepilin-type N-terminal cleavage/methylation domain-containing protein
MNSHHEPLGLRMSLRRGFTLIELVIAISIVAVLAGAAIPVTAKVLTYKARKATREELQVLGDAALEHFRDTRTIPTTVSNLMVDSNVAGWSGPYLGGAVTDQLTRHERLRGRRLVAQLPLHGLGRSAHDREPGRGRDVRQHRRPLDRGRRRRRAPRGDGGRAQAAQPVHQRLQRHVPRHRTAVDGLVDGLLDARDPRLSSDLHRLPDRRLGTGLRPLSEQAARWSS